MRLLSEHFRTYFFSIWSFTVRTILHILWKFDNSEYFLSNFSKGVPASVIRATFIPDCRVFTFDLNSFSTNSFYESLADRTFKGEVAFSIGLALYPELINFWFQQFFFFDLNWSAAFYNSPNLVFWSVFYENKLAFSFDVPSISWSPTILIVFQYTVIQFP